MKNHEQKQIQNQFQSDQKAHAAIVAQCRRRAFRHFSQKTPRQMYRARLKSFMISPIIGSALMQVFAAIRFVSNALKFSMMNFRVHQIILAMKVGKIFVSTKIFTIKPGTLPKLTICCEFFLDLKIFFCILIF